MSGKRALPYVVGQWVRGDRFYGRERLIREILSGPRNSVWVLSTRRTGKTSLLRQLEHLTNDSDSEFVPLFWDFQGADEPRELHLSFHDALLDTEDRLAGLGIDLEVMDSEDLFRSLSRLRRHLTTQNRKLLLLCDEVEELIKLHPKDPSLLRKLRRALQAGDEIRSVMTSTIRLWELSSERDATSPFLHGFTPPLYLAAMSDEEARSLLEQNHLPESERPVLDSRSAERIRTACANHPFLLQLTGKRFQEIGEVDQAIEQVGDDEMVSYFFAVDFEMLSSAEQEILRTISESSTTTVSELESKFDLSSAQLARRLQQLECLGFLRREGEMNLAIANSFFHKWIRHSAAQKSPPPDRSRSRTPFSQRITEILSQIDTNPGVPNPASPQELLDEVYDDLRRLAHRYMSRERRDHTLQPTALVHEAYMKLANQSRVEWRGRTHFFAVGAQAMRRILIDHARTRQRNKRGGDWLRISWAEEVFPSGRQDLSDEQLLDLDKALGELSTIDERQARVVELRFFGGLTVDEVADVLGVSKRTADGDWAKARSWLKQRLNLTQDLS